MFERALLPQILQLLSTRPAVVLLGPRQVGKTTLAHSVSDKVESIYVDLEAPGDARRLEDPEYFFQQNQDKLIVVDEVQRAPELFPIIRSQIDRNRRVGRRNTQFLLLGSATNDLLHQSSESLAGRVSYQELAPLTLTETGEGTEDDLWLRGGFPDAFIEAETSFDWRQDFIRTYLERDIPMLGVRIPAETLRRFWTMLAHHHSQTYNASQIGASLGVKGQTTSRYLDLMADLMLVRRLQPWSSNVGKRLVKSPKVYVRDSGLLHALLGIRTLDELLGHPVAGASWEGFVVENILRCVSATTEHYFYRTQAGAELDLVLKIDGEIWGIEVKRSLSPSLTRGFYNAIEDIQPVRKVLIYPGEDSYEQRGGIETIPIATFLGEFAS